ncbi:MAG: exo-alpha-sialidase [Azonexus sp.]|jgi:predicted neuraminidase|uniref:exo-alpha-sialidase n=1 Tax=Azonexus sp. TaxID=1872668 RepID=UPI00282323D9|nr:exo-alpha-sialidase [Azonexus sp.]MDR0776060.1 exo-alpha-sialidase [Azonexus sp.]
MPSLPALPRWLPALLFTAALGAAFWRIPDVAAPTFESPPPAAPSRLPPLFAAQMLPAAGAVAGAPSLAQLADGRIAAAWVSGSDETATDLAIYFSLLGSDGWSEPRPIANRESTAGGLFAHIRRVGRPQLYVEGTWLHLWYAAIGIGGNTNVVLAHSVSTNGGRNWSPPARLPTSPLAGYGTVPAGPPLPLADGGLALPLQHELFAGHGEWLRLNANGRSLDKARLAHPRRTPQPAVVNLDARRALALLRDAGPPPGWVRAVASDDGGTHWQAVPDPGPANPDTPLAALRLASGRLLLAGNPGSEQAGMKLWLSTDEGRSWLLRRGVGANDDCSSPALLLSRDGRIHLACVSQGRRILHVSSSEAWLE